MRIIICLFFASFLTAGAFGCRNEEATPDSGSGESFCEGIDCSGHGECREDEVRAWCECEEGFTAHMWNCVPLQTDADADVDSPEVEDADAEVDAEDDADARTDGEADVEIDAEVDAEVDVEE